MSQDCARRWLSEHNELVPALDCYQHQALTALESKSATLADLADIISLDPGMSISLFYQINSKRQNSGRSDLNSVHNALALLGTSALADFIMQHKTVSQMHPHSLVLQSFHQLLSRGYHLLSQLQKLIEIQGINPTNEIRSAAILHNVGELCACLFDFDSYQQYQKKYNSIAIETNSARPVFGFDFGELGCELVSHWHLPELVGESLVENAGTGRKAHLIRIAAEVSHQAEIGWNHPAMRASLDIGASYLNLSPHEFEKQTKAIAVQSAREFPLADVFTAAARMILMPDNGQSSPVRQTSTRSVEPKASTHSEDKIRALIQSPVVDNAQIINLLMHSLHTELHLPKLVLILLSRNKRLLTTRLAMGLQQDSPFFKLKLKVGACGLLKTLLEKPRALWVTSDNYQKLSPQLPEKFKSTCLSENFFLMSLAIKNKPIGFIYATRSGTLNRLDAQVYADFKACISTAGKAITIVSLKNKAKTI